MSRVGSAVGAPTGPDTRGEADAPADVPADVRTEAEGAAVRAERRVAVAVAVALPQPATKVATRAAPRSVRIAAPERRIIRLPRSSQMPRPLNERGRLIPPSMECRPGACQTGLGRHFRRSVAPAVIPVLLWRFEVKRKHLAGRPQPTPSFPSRGPGYPPWATPDIGRAHG